MTPNVRSTPHRRVVVTGLGVKAPGASTAGDLWGALCRGRSVAAPIERFDASGLPVGFACEVRAFAATDYMSAKQARRLDRAVQLALGAGLDAVDDAKVRDAPPERCAVIVGTAQGGVETFGNQVEASLANSEWVSPLALPMLMPNAAPANLGMALGWTGPNMVVTTACASGAHAIGEAARLIRHGESDVALAGGTEAAICPVMIGGFWRMGLLSESGEDPAGACRPFDRSRTGFVIGEGAGFLVLEDRDRAERRGARIHAELVGYGRNGDASHISTPAPGGVGAATCMRLALADAGVAASAVGHVDAHGTGTRLNDAREAEALATVFGPAPPPVTAAKGVIGHLLGAAGAVEAIAAVLSLRHRAVPPTANFETGDAEPAIDVVAGEPRPSGAGLALSNSFGFGGHNASLLFAAEPD